MKTHYLFIVAFLASVSFASEAGGTPDLTYDDAALIRHIKSTDDVFVRVLGACGSERVSRSKGGKFTYLGNCEIKPLPETDCQHYLVTAIGTIDTKAWATVRDIRLKLQCSA
jgi:hypothetical protein